MSRADLTVRSITARAIVLKLKRPVVARIATLFEWPVILIDPYKPAPLKQSCFYRLTYLPADVLI